MIVTCVHKFSHIVQQDEKIQVAVDFKHGKLFIAFFNSGHFLFFCSSSSAFKRNDFGVEPFPSLQASGKLFWGAGNNFWQPKTQLAMFV